MNNSPFLLPAGEDYFVLNRSTNPNPNSFYLRGLGPTMPQEPHTIVLQDVSDTGHLLHLVVHNGITGSFIIENASDKLLNKSDFSIKHGGLTRKRFKAGDILTPPEVYTLNWLSLNFKFAPVLVTLSLIPLPHFHGLRLSYTVE